jgi:hypothetical protein
MDLAASNTDDLMADVDEITGDISPDDHKDLDKVIASLNMRLDSNSAGMLLFLVISTSASAYSKTNWTINPAMADVTACGDLLSSNHEILGLLQEAHRSGQYSQIRRRGEWPYPHSHFLY